MSAEAKEIIRFRNAQFEKLYKENKIDEMVDMYAVDAKVMPAGRPIYIGRPAIKEYLQGAYDPACHMRIISEEVLELGDDAILDREKYLFLKGDEVLDEGKAVVVHKKIDGKWFFYIEIANRDRS